MHKQKISILSISLLGMIGSATTWATVSGGDISIAVSGFKVGVGMVTAFLFLASLVLAAFGKLKNPNGLVRKIFLSLFNIINLGLAAWAFSNIGALDRFAKGLSKDQVKVSAGWGLWLTILASLALIIVPWVLGKKAAEAAAPAAPEAPEAPVETPEA